MAFLAPVRLALMAFGFWLFWGDTEIHAQISVTSSGVNYANTFDSLPSNGTTNWNNNTTLPGWYAISNNIAPASLICTTSTSASSSGLYSFGTVTDRWVGAIPTGGSGPISLGLRLLNNSSTNFSGSMNILFDSRRLNSGTVHLLLLSKKFSNGQGSLTNLPAGSSITLSNPPVITDYNGWTEIWRTNALAGDSNDIPVNLSSFSLAANEEVWLAWMMIKTGGNNSPLGIDDVRVQMSPPPSSAPVITSAPVNQTVVEGATATFSATVTGNPTPTLQWLQNPNAISGATNNTLILTNVLASQAGSYQLVASNSAGTASNSATLTVRAAPPVFTPAAGTVFWPTNVSLACTTSNALIRYTTDGTDPTPSSGTLYSGSISLNQSIVLKAVAYRLDLSASTVASASFTFSLNSANPDDFLTSRFAAVTTNTTQFHSTNNYKGNNTNLLVDIYRPAGDTATNRPVAMLIHGGGFRTSVGRDQSYIVTYANELAQRGFVAMSIDYRLRSGTDMPAKPDELPALKDGAADALMALKWMRQGYFSGLYGYDPNLIFIVGGSAGGRIAAALACRETGDTGGLPTTDLYSPTGSAVTSDASAVYDRTGCVAAAVLWGGPEAWFRCYTVDAGDLPTTLIHGTYDDTLPTDGSPTLYRQLVTAGVPAELHLALGLDHSLNATAAASATAANAASAQTADWVAKFFVQEWKRRKSGVLALSNPVAAVTRTAGQGLTLTAPFSSSYSPAVSWRKDGATLPGQTGAVLTLPAVAVADAGRYQAVLSTPLASWNSNVLSTLDLTGATMSAVTYTNTNNYTHPVEMVLEVADVTVSQAVLVGPTFASEFGGVAADSDGDGDGVAALLEYAFGGATNRNDQDRMPAAAFSNNELSLIYLARTNDTNLSIVPEQTTNLSATNGWITNGITITPQGTTNLGGTDFERRKAAAQVTNAPAQFLRLRVRSGP